MLFTEDGDVLTSAGAASGIDLCLHMIRTDHGAAVANEVARGTVVPPHRDGGQAQYIPRPVAEPSVSSTAGARAWAQEHLGRPVTIGPRAAGGDRPVDRSCRRRRGVRHRGVAAPTPAGRRRRVAERVSRNVPGV